MAAGVAHDLNNLLAIITNGIVVAKTQMILSAR
jgi:hypothetical protein